MDKNDAFTRALDKLETKMKIMKSRAEDVRLLYGMDKTAAAYAQALKLEEAAEQAVMLSRALPAYTGNPNANRDVENIIRNNIPVRIGFTSEGWFFLEIPLLPPKKESGSAGYVRSFLYPAFRDFFRSRQPVRYTDCVIIYRHVYDRLRPERNKRDHDNIEINMVTDIVAMYVMPDDSPSVCSHHYCSAAGGRERTEVYVVPKTDFHSWLEAGIPEDGPELHKNTP